MGGVAVWTGSSQRRCRDKWLFREMTATTVRFSPEAWSRWFPNASPLFILALEARLNAGREGIGIWFRIQEQNVSFQEG